MTPRDFREVSAQHFAEKLRESSLSFGEFLREISRSTKMVCANSREISRSLLRESSRLRIFVRGVNAKKRAFFLGWSVVYW